MLAHVDPGRVASSCYDAGWIAWAEQHLGRATDRSLAADVRVLERTLASNEHLAAAQALAWMWNDAAQARGCAQRDLAELTDDDVADTRALRTARAIGPAVEVLRAAAELELPRLAEIHAPYTDTTALARALSRAAPAAPELGRVRIELAPPLPRRGRAWGPHVWVGMPGIAGAETEHVAWQAAHEATVVEVGRLAEGHETVERMALGLLRSRARRAGLTDAHRRWLETLDVAALGPIPDVDDLPE